MKIEIPEVCLVVLIGPSGSGKSTFAKTHFRPTEILSSDVCRGLVADDENDQDATQDAFHVLHEIAGRRLARQRLTVVDATNVQPEARKPLIQRAREHHVLPVAIVFDLPARLCLERNAARTDRQLSAHVVRRHVSDLKRSLRNLKREGFRRIVTLDDPSKAEHASIERQRLWTDRREDHGPFDVIGDVHGCFDELVALLRALHYDVTGLDEGEPMARHPEGRRAFFVGDLVDRGPNSPAVLHLVMNMVDAGTAWCVPGNHEAKLLKYLNGRNVQLKHGLEVTVAQLEARDEAFKHRVRTFIESLISHYVLDDGKLVVAHAGMKEAFQGRASGAVRSFALYGETTGETDEFGLLVRYEWAQDYRGKATVVYGHTPTPDAEWLNRTICIDTGCVFGGRLTALRYPEKELVDVPALAVHYEPAKPLVPPGEARAPFAGRDYAVLDLEDVSGKRRIETRLARSITIREAHAAAALEVMSRFAVDPRWLIYLPPTMSPASTMESGEFLEHPEPAFRDYVKAGVHDIVCQEKHMGSRAVVVVCRDEAAAARRFRIEDAGIGVVTTRTGRSFFHEDALEQRFLERVRDALDASGLFDELATDWVCLDTELMPWSAKAQELLRSQYAAVGSAARHALNDLGTTMERAARRGVPFDGVFDSVQRHTSNAEAFTRAYRQYCWPVQGLDDLVLAPFHLLASEGHVHTDRDHPWHMDRLSKLVAVDSALFRATRNRIVDLRDPVSVEEATRWWMELTGDGGEGMVIKPREWIVRSRRGLAQPAIKCRGREYLRIIYGPNYTEPEHLERLRTRGLSLKRSLALREFALGLEALHRFVDGEPLYRIHECVFAVLALESEPVDPRL